MEGKPAEDKASQPNLVERGGVGHHDKAAVPHGGNNGDITAKENDSHPEVQTSQASAKDLIGHMDPVDAIGTAFYNMQLYRLNESSDEGAARNAKTVFSQPNSQETHRAQRGRRPGSNVHKVGRKIARNFGVVVEEEETEE